jgi:uncharacterized protein (DUF1697 family)
LPRYVCLLRGINVGGNNLIKMADLKRCFESLGFKDVSTYIASGNVLFTAPGTAAALAKKIEPALSKAFNYQASVVLRSQAQLSATVDEAPKGFGADPAKYRYDAVFVKEPLKAKEALPQVPAAEGVDRVWAGDGVLYFSRLIARASTSKLTKLVGTPVYKQVTIRNWNTTTALLKLMEAA